MWPPSTENAPFDPEMVPVVAVPSPQSMIAVKPLAGSERSLSVKVATVVLSASAARSVAEVKTTRPKRFPDSYPPQNTNVVVGALWIAGHVYDLGKIALPPNLLTKEGPLNDAEMLILRSHVSIGYDLLRDWAILRTSPHWLHDLVLETVLFHHER